MIRKIARPINFWWHMLVCQTCADGRGVTHYLGDHRSLRRKLGAWLYDEQRGWDKLNGRKR